MNAIEHAGNIVVPESKRLTVSSNHIYLGMASRQLDYVEQSSFTSNGLGKQIVGTAIGDSMPKAFFSIRDKLYFNGPGNYIVTLTAGKRRLTHVGEVIGDAERLGLTLPYIRNDTVTALGTDGYNIYLIVDGAAKFKLDQNLKPFNVSEADDCGLAGFSSPTAYFEWTDGLSWQKYSHGMKTGRLEVDVLKALKQYETSQLAAIGYPYERIASSGEDKLPFKGKADLCNPNIAAFTDGSGVYCLTGDGAVWHANKEGGLADIIAVTQYADDIDVPILTANNNGLAALLHGEELRLFSKGEQVFMTELEQVDSWLCTDMAMTINALYFLVARDVIKFDLK